MSELTREQIEEIKQDSAQKWERTLFSLCDMALRTLDAEKDANEQRVRYDDLFDEAEKIRIQRDQARQEAANLREALKQMTDADNFDRMIARNMQSAPPASEPKVYQCPRCATSMEVDETAKPAPADRPEPSEALEAFSRVRDFIADCEVGDTEPGTGKNEENREVDAHLVDLDYMIHPYISQPAPAVPDDAVMCPFCESKGYVTDKKHKYQALNARMRTWHGPSVDDSTHPADSDSPAVPEDKSHEQ